MNTIIFKVDDMHCPSCPKIIAMNLEEVQGILNAEASLETKEVKVVFDPALTDAGKVGDIIRHTGYTPKLLVNLA